MRRGIVVGLVVAVACWAAAPAVPVGAAVPPTWRAAYEFPGSIVSFSDTSLVYRTGTEFYVVDGTGSATQLTSARTWTKAVDGGAIYAAVVDDDTRLRSWTRAGGVTDLGPVQWADGGYDTVFIRAEVEGDMVAFVRGEDELVVFDRATSTERVVATGVEGTFDVAADGSVAYVAGGVWLDRGGELTELAPARSDVRYEGVRTDGATTLFAAYGTAYVDAQYRRHVVLVSSDGTTPTVVAGPHPCRAYIDVRCAWPNGIPTPDEDFAVNAGVAVWRDGTGVWRSVDGGPVHPVNAPADVAHLTLNSAGDLLIRPYTGEFGEGVTWGVPRMMRRAWSTSLPLPFPNWSLIWTVQWAGPHIGASDGGAVYVLDDPPEDGPPTAWR